MLLVGCGGFQAQWVKLGWAAHNKDICESDAYTPGSLENLGTAPYFIFTPGEGIQPEDHQIGGSPSERGLDDFLQMHQLLAFLPKQTKTKWSLLRCPCAHT